MYGLLPNEVIFLPSFGSGECHVGHREKEPNVVVITVVELAGVYDQVPRLTSLSDEINFVGGYFGAPRGSRLQERGKLRHTPLACTKLGKLTPRDAGRINLKC